ncbi:MAG: hypothetical protein AAFY71_24365 [Bacteroidota bacterium]
MKILPLYFKLGLALLVCCSIQSAKAQSICDSLQEAAIYDTNAKRYHYYEVTTDLIGLDDPIAISKKDIFLRMISQRGFVAPVSKKPELPLIHGEPFDVKIAFLNRNPVIACIDSSRFTVINYALKGHFLYPGYVKRQVIENGGKYAIQTTSEGLGRFPKMDEKKASNIWESQDQKILNALINDKGL